MANSNNWEKSNVIIAFIAVIITLVTALMTINKTQNQFDKSVELILEERKQRDIAEKPIIISEKTESYLEKKVHVSADVILKNMGKRDAFRVDYLAELLELTKEGEIKTLHIKRKERINPLLPHEKISLYLSTNSEYNFKNENRKWNKDSEYFVKCQVRYYDNFDGKSLFHQGKWTYNWLYCKSHEEGCELEDVGIENLDDNIKSKLLESFTPH